MLGISSSFIEDTKDDAALDKSTREQIVKVLNQNPNISSIHIQGIHPIPRKEFLKIVQDQSLPLTTFFTQTYFSGANNDDAKLLLHPALVFNSDYIKSYLEFAKHTDFEDQHLQLIDHEILVQINSHANDFSKLEINQFNFMDFYRAADFLQIKTLKEKCEEFISETIRNQASGLQKEEAWEFALEWATLLSPMTNDTLISAIIRALSESNDIESVKTKLETLKERDIDLFSLQSLDLSSDSITDEILMEIVKHFPNVTSLNLSHTMITNAIGPQLAKLTNLQQLDLSDCEVTDAIGPQLAKLTNLQQLDLSACPRLTDAIGPQLAKLTNLQQLDLSACLRLTDAIGPQLAKLTNLQSLNLSACPRLTDAIGPQLAKLTLLQSLNLSCSRLKDAIGPQLAKLTNLQQLDLSGCFELTDAIGPQLAKITNLQQLDLSGCFELTDAIGPQLAKITNLQQLDLSRCWKLTDGIRLELTKFLNLKNLYF